MIHMTLSQAANLLGLSEITTDKEFYGLCLDTRQIQPNNLFIAIPGSRVDGHDYLEEARQKGAAGALVTRHVDSSPLPQLVVHDIVQALGTLGSTWRNHFSIPVIAVTGSNGKTTLKNMIASIMVAACNGNDTQVLSTKGNLNNHLGLPLTLSQLGIKHRYAVIEMGMNHFGEIAYLSKLTHPNVAVITNAGPAHLEGVGDLAGVARAKGEIFLGLPRDGTAILNRDDTYYAYWREQLGHHKHVSFGLDSPADVSATVHEATQTQHLTLHTSQGDVDIQLPLLGKHNIQNALAATAATLAIGISLEAIKSGLETIAPAPGRLQIHTLQNGVNIIDDTYNANPFSLQAAVEALATFPGKRIVVLGDMKELGSDASSLHHSAGQKIRTAGIDHLFTYGDLSTQASKAFGHGAFHFTEQSQLVSALKPYLQNKTTVLVKGSRSMRMEKVVAELMQ